MIMKKHLFLGNPDTFAENNMVFTNPSKLKWGKFAS